MIRVTRNFFIKFPGFVGMFSVYKFILTILVAITIFGTVQAQEEVSKLNWIRAGSCWVAEPGFLYCSEQHPYAEKNSKPFVSLVCFQQYRAVVIGHSNISDDSKVRNVRLDFGNKQFDNIWIAAAATETFMSNNVEAENFGYNNLLKGISNPKAEYFGFEIDPGSISGTIPLTGIEYQAAGAYIDICATQQQ